MDNNKKCNICQQEKSLSLFGKIPYKESYIHRNICKTCRKEQQKEYKNKVKKLPKPPLKEKECATCKKTLPFNHFTKNNRQLSGLASSCKECCKQYNIKRFENLQIVKAENKICPKCEINKKAEDFWTSSQTKDGLSRHCKICIKTQLQKYKNTIRENNKKRRHQNSTHRIILNIRRRILLAIKGQFKATNTIKLLGCTGSECMDHLETLFWPGMTRENHGRDGWVIDHIKPIDAFDKTDPNWQYKAFHYTNLQPLWYKDNNKKLARLDWTPQESKYELPERLKAHLDKTPESGGIS